jgi:hypothetical protein
MSNVNYDQTQPLYPLGAPSYSSDLIDLARFVRSAASGALESENVAKNMRVAFAQQKARCRVAQPTARAANGSCTLLCKTRLTASRTTEPFAPTVLAWTRCSQKAKHEKAVGSVGRSDVGGHCHRLQLL